MKNIKEYLAASLLIIIIGGILYYVGTDPISIFQEQIDQLYTTYKNEPTTGNLQKLHQAEGELIEHIKEEGFEAVIEADEQQELKVLDTTQYTVIATLIDGDVIKIYEKHYNGMFFILTSEGSKGYLLHEKFSPSIDAFPLKLLVSKTKAIEEHSFTPTAEKTEKKKADSSTSLTTKKKLLDTKERGGKTRPSVEQLPKPVPPNNNCKKVRCVGLTQKETRCKRNTFYCNERCFQHQ